MHLIGVDFTSVPRRSKPITVAHGEGEANALHITHVDEFINWASYENWLVAPGKWIGAFDFPFGLPRELIETLGWPLYWHELVNHCAALSRAEMRTTFQAFCNARAVGNKFAHRLTDGPAGSSPSMKWVNPPVAYMFKEGALRLLQAGVTIPGLLVGDPNRIALEGYPGLIARAVTRASYKSDARAKQTPQRRTARLAIVEALREGRHPLGITVSMPDKLQDRLIEDGMADWLDAVLCAVAACWASNQPAYGMPPWIDTLEGWTAAAPYDAVQPYDLSV